MGPRREENGGHGDVEGNTSPRGSRPRPEATAWASPACREGTGLACGGLCPLRGGHTPPSGEAGRGGAAGPAGDAVTRCRSPCAVFPLSGPLRFAMRQCDSAVPQEPGVSWSKSLGSPDPSLPAEQAAGCPPLPLSSSGLSQGDVSRQHGAGPLGAGHVDGLGPEPADAQAEPTSEEPGPAPFVPFSGGGQRLGGPSGSARCLVSPSAKLPKSFSSPGGPSEPKKSRPGQEPQPEPEPEPVRVEPGPGVLAPDPSAGPPGGSRGAGRWAVMFLVLLVLSPLHRGTLLDVV